MSLDSNRSEPFARDRGKHGFTIIEMVMAMAVFTVLILTLAILESEMIRFDRSMRIDLFTHPEKRAVLSRLRADVLDSTGYPVSHEGWSQTPRTLVLRLPADDSGSASVVVWDFETIGEAHRIEYRGGEQVRWHGRGVPALEVDATEMPDGTVGVALTGLDDDGRLILHSVQAPRVQ